MCNTPENYWHEFTATLKDRVRKPWKHPTFVMYFFGIIFIVGSFGVLEPLVSCMLLRTLPPTELPGALISASYTYFVAIAATAAVDLILSYHQHRRKFLLMFFLLSSLAVYACAFVAAIYVTFLHRPASGAVPAVLGYVLALILWWLANADNVNLLDTPVQSTAPIGADAQAQMTGDLTGFKVQ
jgi:hypothetical protein